MSVNKKQGVRLILDSTLSEAECPRRAAGTALLLMPSGEPIPFLKRVSLDLDANGAVIVTAEFYAGSVAMGDTCKAGDNVG